MLNTLGNHLQKRRLDLELRRKDVAARMHVDAATLTSWSKGRGAPSATVWPSVIRFLGYDPRPEPTTVGEALKRYRGSAGVSQRTLAGRLHVDQKTLAWWEQGIRMPQGKHLARVLSILKGEGLNLDSVKFGTVGGNPEQAPNTLGQTLVRYRAENGITQKRLAAELGVHPRTLAKWELDYRAPTAESLRRVQRMLGSDVSVPEVVGCTLGNR